MAKLFWHAKLYYKIICLNYKSKLKYHGKREFFHTLGMFLGYASDIFAIGLSMSLFKFLGGFNIAEVMFLFSFELISYSIANSIVWFSGDTYNLIVRGQLDEFMTKPVNPFFLMLARYYEIGYIGQFAISLTLLFISINNMDIHWGILRCLLYIVTMICSVCIYIGFTTIPSLLAFWFGNTDKLTCVFRWSFKGVIQYPISVYPRPVKIILSTILPYGFINYYPSLILLNKISVKNSLLILLLLLFISSVDIGVIIKLWHKGLRRYESAGG